MDDHFSIGPMVTLGHRGLWPRTFSFLSAKRTSMFTELPALRMQPLLGKSHVQKQHGHGSIMDQYGSIPMSTSYTIFRCEKTHQNSTVLSPCLCTAATLVAPRRERCTWDSLNSNFQSLGMVFYWVCILIGTSNCQ